MTFLPGCTVFPQALGLNLFLCGAILRVSHRDKISIIQLFVRGKEAQSDPCALTTRARHAVTEAITSLTLQHKDIMTRKEKRLANSTSL